MISLTISISLGIAYSKLNKHQLALDAYEKAIRLDPDNVDYQNNMSVTKQRLEGLIGSIIQYERGN